MISVISEGLVLYRCETNEEVADFLIAYYAKDCDSCIGEMLCNVSIDGASVDDVVNIYGEVMKRIENDVLIHIVEGEEVRREL